MINSNAPKVDFGYAEMLAIRTPFDPASDDLDDLAEFMTTIQQRVPAGFTYLSQFIDHDISLDSKSGELPWGTINAATVFNERTPLFDLETIYGKDVPSSQGNISRANLLKTNSLLKLGETAADMVTDVFPNDLPRVPGAPAAQIVDERNDENLAVAQTQVAFIKFHNAIAARLGGGDTTARFDEAREIVIRHYQWIVLHDFLPKIIKKWVLEDVLKNGNKFYLPKPDDVFMPLEFSVAAFRAGHSMVRDSYHWNRLFNNEGNNFRATLAELRTFTGAGGMMGKHNLPSDWLINWNLFFDIDDSSSRQKNRFNFAEPINTKIAESLGRLNPNVIDFEREFSLPAFDLYRARALSLPSGQLVAEKILEGTSHEPLMPEQISELLPDNLKSQFSKQTPLWFYLLAEAEIKENGQTLGEVGSRIIAETFVKLIELSPYSILKDGWQPGKELPAPNGEFGMSEMLKFVADQNKEWDELNPIG